VEIEGFERRLGQAGRVPERREIALLHEHARRQQADPVAERLGEGERVGAEENGAAGLGEGREDPAGGDGALGSAAAFFPGASVTLLVARLLQR